MLEFSGTEVDGHATGFWLSLAYALTNGACQELRIERADLEATTYPIEKANRQAIVIYDAVPGGAGHCLQILKSLPAVIRRAAAILSGCDCDPESTGCYGCLCDYQNQFAHESLSRGPVLRYLNELIEALDFGNPSPWRSAHSSPGRELADSLLAAKGRIDLVFDSITPGPIHAFNKDWFDVLKQIAMRPCGPRSLRVVLVAYLIAK